MVAVSPTVVLAVVDSIEAFARNMLANNGTGKRQELEARVLAAALKQSVERGDRNGALLAYKHLGMLMRQIIDATQEQTQQMPKAERAGTAEMAPPAIPPAQKPVETAPPAASSAVGERPTSPDLNQPSQTM